MFLLLSLIFEIGRGLEAESVLGSAVRKIFAANNLRGEIFGVPQTLRNKLLKKIKPKQIDELIKIFRKYIQTPEGVMKINKYINKGFGLGGKSDFRRGFARAEIKSFIGKLHSKVNIKINLSSSWIKWGLYIPTSEKSGSLMIGVKTGARKTYLYFDVSAETWKKMVGMTGSYGSGAGSAFWDNYLFKFHKRTSPSKKISIRKMAVKESRFIKNIRKKYII